MWGQSMPNTLLAAQMRAQAPMTAEKFSTKISCKGKLKPTLAGFC
jgi:hypothetical protein